MRPTVTPVSVTGIGLTTALGHDLEQVRRHLANGAIAVAPQTELALLPSPLAGVVEGPDLKAWLKRRKDRKLMSRAAILALPAAGLALGAWPGDRDQLGLYVGVGREPPDEGDSEPSLVFSHRDGGLDCQLLATEGFARYPPLLPLQTLPNMILAHLSIVFEARGENGALAGSAAAGLLALTEAIYAVAEGRVPAALAGAADSHVAFGAARDEYRLGRASAARPPGEGAVFFLLESRSSIEARGARALYRLSPGRRTHSGEPTPSAHWPALGHLGSADALLRLALSLPSSATAEGGELEVTDDDGVTVSICWHAP